MIDRIALYNLVISIVIVVIIYVFSYFLDPEFGKFTAAISGTGLFLAWLCSPKHRVLDGIRSISFFEWPALVIIMFVFTASDLIPKANKVIILLSVFWGGVGLIIAKNKGFK